MIERLLLFFLCIVGLGTAEDHLAVEEFERLHLAVFGNAEVVDLPDLEKNMRIYVREFRKKKSLKELADFLFDLPSDDTRNKVMPFRKRMILIIALEDLIGHGSNRAGPKEISDANTRLKILYTELCQVFRLKSLPCFALNKLGEFLRDNEEEASKARPYFEEVLKRKPNPEEKAQASFGLAAILAGQGEEENARAFRLLAEVKKQSKNVERTERAEFQIISLHARLKSHKEVIDSSKTYLQNKRYRRYRDEVRLLLADSYEQTGKTDDALVIYTQIWSSSNVRFCSVIVPIRKWMELLWKRNKPGDRQLAYERGFDYLKMTGRAIKRARPEEKAKWNELSVLVKQYEESPVIEKR